MSERVDRRGFLTSSVVFGLGLFTGSEARNLPNQEEPQLPDDVLTDKELENANITIYQARQTQLYLRRSAFEMPLFQDARCGKITHLTIALIDEERLYPQRVEELPEEFLGHYHIHRQFEQQELAKYQVYLTTSVKLMADDEEKFKKGELDQDRYQANQNWYQQQMEEYQKTIARMKIIPLAIFMGGPKVAELIPYLFRDHPELADSVTIYLAVGGILKPHPNQSFPNPEQIPQKSVELINPDRDYRVYPESVSAGFILHHEAAHYEYLNEYMADTKALESLAEGHYPFIFVNDNGLTFTKNLSLSDPLYPGRFLKV